MYENLFEKGAYKSGPEFQSVWNPNGHSAVYILFMFTTNSCHVDVVHPNYLGGETINNSLYTHEHAYDKDGHQWSFWSTFQGES